MLLQANNRASLSYFLPNNFLYSQIEYSSINLTNKKMRCNYAIIGTIMPPFLASLKHFSLFREETFVKLFLPSLQLNFNDNEELICVN